jgi:small multidrug resistance family-3 protein
MTMTLPAALGLFALTALAEIVGCWLVWLWARHQASAWWLVPAALALAAFAWLLTLHPAASGRIYAAYGGVYVVLAVGWLWAVDGIRPDRYDLLGLGLILAGVMVMLLAHWQR